MSRKQGEQRPLSSTDVDAALGPDSPSTQLSEQAYARLKDDIITCRLEPGRPVTEGQLADRLGCGKAPVRTALARLGQEGLVRALPRRGYQISPVTLGDVQDLFEVRLMLEPQAAERAAGRVDADRLRQFDAVCRAGYTSGDRESERRFWRANTEFHVAVAEASGNRRLASLVGALLCDMERVIHVGMAMQNRTEEIQHEHQLLVDALESGDGHTSRQLMIEQVNDARNMVLNALLLSDSVRGAEVFPGKRNGTSAA